MKFERKLFKISIVETLLYLMVMLFLINGTAFLITLIIGKPRIFIHEGSWISQFLFPLVYSLIQNGINRNGIFIATEYADYSSLKSDVDELISKKGLSETGEKSGFHIYTKETTFGKLLSFIISENIKVKYSDNETIILAKRNVLVEIEQKFKKYRV